MLISIRFKSWDFNDNGKVVRTFEAVDVSKWYDAAFMLENYPLDFIYVGF